ncbi:HD domain-containing protein [Chryseobacterium scophthalmum]|uniref:Guanosine-3',5'-bis(Diphosphate) 3'-pyrophosphohydrolase n=1 Tax=Chryseobacterium scophthalmum TaxID=59733 RepID=A0A1N6FR75_9FLAO|nr:HD domain-containing protein [Chryseobacterium scophthalmum]SIN97770.1 guanosine-3',5'-bis(diphosphate) 3'-pyrophosphohydrolase [Chryseobacterium scophthalmum]
MNIQDIYQRTIKFAAQKHTDSNQTIPGTNLPYIVHLSNVAMEIFIAAEKTKNFNIELAIQVSLLHDILEDTEVTFDELENEFGKTVAIGVLALTKKNNLPKEDKMMDSLQRIKQQSKEVWAVKLADRITNLQRPPHFWSVEKIKKYKEEALTILNELSGGNEYLENRLGEKIKDYNL